MAAQKEERVIGMIAQEVQRVLPNLVHEDPATGCAHPCLFKLANADLSSRYLSVNYTDLVPILLEAIKQLQVSAECVL